MEQQSQGGPATPPPSSPPPQDAPPAQTAPPPAPPAQGGPPAAQASGWVMPQPASTRGSVTGLAKLGALFLVLIGLFWTIVGLLALVAGEVFRSLLEGYQVEGFGEGQVADIVAGAIIGVGVVILVVALVEVAVGVFAWRGSGLARALGILYGLFFGAISLLMASGASQPGADGTGGAVVLLAIGAAYLYTVVVFIIRWRSPA